MDRQAVARRAADASTRAEHAIRTHGLCSRQAKTAITDARRAWADALAAGLTADQINAAR